MSPRTSHRSPAAAPFALLSLLSLFRASPGFGAAWDDASNPFLIDPRFESRLGELPASAVLPAARLPWSGPFWADRGGSIGLRWQSGETADFDLLSAEAIRALPAERAAARIAAMSPAAKVDLARGRYDYPTVAHVRRADPARARAWEGLCSGWAQTALLFDEPAPTVYRNPDGIDVPFGSADLKALAAFYFDEIAAREGPGGAAIDERRTLQLGRVCDPGDPRGECRRDVNAGALHILLANRIGLRGRGVIADFSRGRQVWQHPIHGYSAKIDGERPPRRDAARTAVREVRVRLDLAYADYAPPAWSPTGLRARERTLRYWLELDAADRIVGGRYVALGGGRALDYLWVSEAIAFRHGYEILGEMLSPRR